MGPRRSPLYDHHEERGGRFTEFGGWEMPVEFDSISEEHRAVRSSVGKFDVSHMGQVVVTGPDAGALTDRLVTNRVAALDVGRARYAAITDESGVMHDDTVVYRRPDDYLFVPNAGHETAAVERFERGRDRYGLDAQLRDRTEELAMVAVQGPEAVDMVADAVEAADTPLRALSRFGATGATVAGADCWVARTGYTGEDGLELIAPAGAADAVWTALDCQPCGLGARDTLRLEAGFLLSGQDFHPETEPRTPYEAGIGFAVDLDREFVGRDALAAQAEAGVEERLVGLRLLDRGIARHGHAVTVDGREVGHVTSGTRSPTLEASIALAYVPVEFADPGTELAVVIRDDPKDARVVETPFLDG
jgi:aminomethyltransferase